MSAYVVMVREYVLDPAETAAYGRMAPSAGEGHAVTPLAFYGEVLERPLVDGIVILQLPTLREAKNWYYSPPYQAACMHPQLGWVPRLPRRGTPAITRPDSGSGVAMWRQIFEIIGSPNRSVRISTIELKRSLTKRI